VLNQHDRYPERDAVSALSDRAYRLDSHARHWAAGAHTDGLISEARVHLLLPGRLKRFIDELVAAGLWLPRDSGHFELVDHMKWNESKADHERRVMIGRASANKRWHPPPRGKPNRSATGKANANGTAKPNANRNARASPSA
jgi:hypothetical protein